MKTQIVCKFQLGHGAAVTYSIEGRDLPIAEIYYLDNGFLVLHATTIGGYTRKVYMSQESAEKAATCEAIRFAKYYWDEAEIVYAL